ncbi:MAG: hypothetical protein WAL25_06935 [Acidimicrobiia bacterium]
MGLKDKFSELTDKAKVTVGELATKAQPHVDKAMKTANEKTNEWADKLAESGKTAAKAANDATDEAADSAGDEEE